MKSATSTESNDRWLVKKDRKSYRGIAAMLHFAECDGIVIAKNARALKKLARGFYLTTVDMKKTKRVVVEKDK